MRDVVICEPVRTPVGRQGGVFKDKSAVEMGVAALKGLLDRTGLPHEAVDDVIFAQCYPTMEAPALGRVVALDAGMPITTPGIQIDRRCGSGLQAVIYGVMQVATGGADLVIAGGSESMSNGAFFTHQIRSGPKGDGMMLHDSLKFFLDSIVVVDRLVAIIEHDLFRHRWSNCLSDHVYLLVLIRIVDDHAVDRVAKDFTNGSEQKGLVAVDTSRGSQSLRLLGDFFPHSNEIKDVGPEFGLSSSVTLGSANEAEFWWANLVANLLESVSLASIVDLAADGNSSGFGQQHDVAARKGDASRNSGALSASRTFGDLHHDLLARLEKIFYLAASQLGSADRCR